MMNILRRKLMIAYATLFVGFGLGVGTVHLMTESHAATAAPSTAPAVAASSTPVAGQPVDFSSIVDHYGPAVVNISVTGKAQRVQRFPGFPQLDPDDPFFPFFQQFGPQMRQQPEPVVPHGLGSGFIVSADGLVMTNAHVVNDADEVVVKLTDRREFHAKVLGSDRRSDVAVLKIDAKNLPTVVLGDPNATKVGEPVLAIGSPFGFENSATAGIVSAKSRTLPDDPYVSFMQTDVAVNPGNSGGPLFNLRGEVIGINSQIYSQTGGYQGLSFAIPIDVATKVEDQLVKHGKVSRGRLGIGIQDVTADLAESFGLPKVEGALVSSVEKGSPAEQAGLKSGDVIASVNGQTIGRAQELTAKIYSETPGDKITLDIYRDKKRISLPVKIGDLRDSEEVADRAAPSSHLDRFGVTVQPRGVVDGDNPGVVVVASKGAAARAGIRPGDLILSLNNEPVRSPDELKRLVDHSGRVIAVLIKRGTMHEFVSIDLG